MKNITVLITGGGGPGYPLFYKALKASKRYRVKIVAAELNPFAGNLYRRDWVDLAYHVSPNSTERFVGEILRIIEKEKVDVLISAVDEELPVFSRHKADIGRLGCNTILPPEEALENSFDKWTTFSMLKGSIKMPRTYLYDPSLDLHKVFDELGPKVVVKMCRTRGNRYNYTAEDYQEFAFYINKLEKTGKAFICQEFIDGREFNVSLMFNLQGQCIYSVCREKMDPPAIRPNTTAGLIKRDPEMEKSAITAARMLGLSPGATNVEFLKARNGDVYMIEVNGGRHAAQDMNLIHCGINIPELLIEMAFGNHIDVIDDAMIKEGTFCLKYTDEIIVNFSDVADRVKELDREN